MSGERRGYLFGTLAYLCWGLFPLYFKLLRPAGPIEIVAHRVIWSFAAVGLLITVSRGWRRIGALIRNRRQLGLIVLAAILVAINWGTYVYGVNTAHVVETSLGYFINPLVTVLLGVFVLRERLRPAQWAAVGIGAVSVAVLTVDYRRVPYIALTLAASFGLYGLVKKRLGVPAADGLVVESGVLALPALVYVVVLESASGTAAFGHISAAHTVLMILSGPVTAIPLLMFADATNRIPLSSVGLLQYLAPILQLACGVLILGEPMPAGRLAGFALVWVALAVFTWDGIRTARAARALASVEPAFASANADGR